MKNTTPFFSIFLLIMVATASIASAQTEVSIKAGANYSSVIIEDETGDRKETQFTPGFHIGGSVDVPLGGAFYIQPGAFHVFRPVKCSIGIGQFTT